MQFQDFEDLTCVGIVLAPHGLKGELRVRPLTDTPEYYLKQTSFVVETAETMRQFRVREMVFRQDLWNIRFEGVDTRTKAGSLKSARLLLPDEQLRPLVAGEVFLHKIVGCRVEDSKGEVLGNISGTLETGANLVYEVKGGTHEFLVPDSPGIVLDLDVEARRMVIEPIPGLMENEAGDQ